MAKKSETLEEGLDRSATKRGFTGKERHRYIGGALHNMGKAKPRHKGDSKKAPTARVASTTSHKTTTHTTHKPAPVKHTPRPVSEHIHLVAKKNSEASKNKQYDVYSVYKEGSKTPYSSQNFRKLSAAKHEAKIEQDSYNQNYKRGHF